jgi:hypothetical protein
VDRLQIVLFVRVLVLAQVLAQVLVQVLVLVLARMSSNLAMLGLMSYSQYVFVASLP